MPQLTRRQLLSRFLVGVAILLVFLAGAFSGISFEQRRHGLNLSKFWQVYATIKKEYVGTIDADKLVEGAVKGLVSGLDDPYSAYLPPSAHR